MFHQRSKNLQKGNCTELDSNSDRGGTKSTSSNEEVDGCDLGKSAYIANSNSPVVENSIGNDEVPYDVAKGALADEELETISC